MSNLPALVSQDGEVIRALTAGDLLRAAGIEDPASADLSALAEFHLDADHLAGLTREAKTLVSDELVRRCDRLGKWTLHEGALTVKSSSPAAGTTAYDSERLHEALGVLVRDNVIRVAEAVLSAHVPVEPPHRSAKVSRRFPS